MIIILIRHGNAESGMTNPERPLTLSGQKHIEILGQRLSEVKGQIDQIWHSGILRAHQTAEILEKYIAPLNGLEKIEGLSPHGNPEAMQKSLEAEKRNIALVSHLPFLDYLGNIMLTGDKEAEVIHFTTGSALKLIRTGKNWSKEWIITTDD